MKAILLASIMTIVLLVVVTFCFRRFPTPHRARQMLLVYLACLLALIGIWLVTPDNLGFLRPPLLSRPGWLDLPLAIFFFSAGFFGGSLQLYNLTDRGFSLRILIDILEAPPTENVDVGYLMTNYSRGRGVTWMYRKRITDLLAGEFVRQANGSFSLTAKGAKFARLFLFARRFLRIAPRF